MKVYAITKYNEYEKGFVTMTYVSSKKKAVTEVRALLIDGGGQYEWARPIDTSEDNLLHFAIPTQKTILSYEFPCNGGTYKVEEINVK